MIIYDRGGVIEIEVGGKTIEVTRNEMSPEQVASAVAAALGEPVWWLDRSGEPAEDASGPTMTS